jgi:hypothetical protein
MRGVFGERLNPLLIYLRGRKKSPYNKLQQMQFGKKIK